MTFLYLFTALEVALIGGGLMAIIAKEVKEYRNRG